MYGLKPVPFSEQSRTSGAKQAAEKLFRLKGMGFQPVRNYFEMNLALATEGTTLSHQTLGTLFISL